MFLELSSSRNRGQRHSVSPSWIFLPHVWRLVRQVPGGMRRRTLRGEVHFFLLVWFQEGNGGKGFPCRDPARRMALNNPANQPFLTRIYLRSKGFLAIFPMLKIWPKGRHPFQNHFNRLSLSPSHQIIKHGGSSEGCDVSVCDFANSVPKEQLEFTEGSCSKCGFGFISGRESMNAAAPFQSFGWFWFSGQTNMKQTILESMTT